MKSFCLKCYFAYFCTDCIFLSHSCLPVAQQPSSGVGHYWSAAAAWAAGSTEQHLAVFVVLEEPTQTQRETNIVSRIFIKSLFTSIKDDKRSFHHMLLFMQTKAIHTCTACLSYRDIWAIWGARELPPVWGFPLVVPVFWSSPASMFAAQRTEATDHQQFWLNTFKVHTIHMSIN